MQSASETEPGHAPGPMNDKQILQAMSGLMAGMFVAILAGTVVANALPRIIADLGASQSSYTWVVTAELLAMTATVPLWGKLSDLYNQKMLLQLSLSLFIVGSLVAGFSHDVGLLIFSRVVQGIGAGGLTALAQVVMAAIIPPRRLGRYSGYLGATFAVATVGGPLLGGLIVDTSWLGWRWCFFIGVPFALLGIILLQRTLKLPTVRREVTIDYLGAFLIVAGVCALLIWTSLAGNSFDWASWQTAALTLTGAAVAVADKLDTLVGIFGIGMLPTGSKDPYALRRAALGVLRILIEKDLDLDLSAAIAFAIELFGDKVKAAGLAPQVQDFIFDRLRTRYEDEGVDVAVYQAVRALNPGSPLDFDQRVQAVQVFRNLPDAAALAAANKRVSNLLGKFEGEVPATVEAHYFDNPSEFALYAAIQQADHAVQPLAAERRYREALEHLASLREPVDAFFEAVLVNADDASVRANRYALLARLRGLFLGVADISVLG